MTVADKLLTKKKGVAGYGGLGALYQASDGSLYHVQGLSAEELDGLYEDEAVHGVDADDLDGFAADEELRGVAQYPEIQGIDDGATGPLYGEDDVHGYVPEDRVGGLQAYVPVQPAKTRMFDPSRETPDIWKPLW